VRYFRIAVLMLGVIGLAAGLPVLRPVPAAAAEVVGIADLGPTWSAVFIASPAMNQVVQVQVLHPAGGGSRPGYYLLDGLDPGVGQSTWINATDAERFFLGKNVNVVLPVGGKASYFTNWRRDDPVLGRYQWETFLTEELPPIIDDNFSGNGVNAIGGLSMGGHAAYVLAARHPGLYTAVAGYSACPETGMATAAVQFSILTRGGNPDNMWGPGGSPEWAAHDPALMLDRLRGKTLFLSTGTGLPGPHELELKPQLPENIVLGGPIEFGVDTCVIAFERRVRAAGLPIRVDYSPVGTHSWSYWNDHLKVSWPTIGGAIGA
jgi:S-formylglutathione hydrolase FrmB